MEALHSEQGPAFSHSNLCHGGLDFTVEVVRNPGPDSSWPPSGPKGAPPSGVPPAVPSSDSSGASGHGGTAMDPAPWSWSPGDARPRPHLRCPRWLRPNVRATLERHLPRDVGPYKGRLDRALFGDFRSSNLPRRATDR